MYHYYAPTSTDPPVEVWNGVFIGSAATARGLYNYSVGPPIGAVINLSGYSTTSMCHIAPIPTFSITMADMDIPHDKVREYMDKFTTGCIAIHWAREMGVNVLVHCAEGINRSAAQIGIYLIMCEGVSADDAIDLLTAANKKRSTPILTNMSFRELLNSQSHSSKMTMRSPGAIGS